MASLNRGRAMKRVLAALGLIVATPGPVFALDLVQAKFTIEYECRVTY
jgi:hypothetical protein